MIPPVSKLMNFLLPLAGGLGMLGGLATDQLSLGIPISWKIWVFFPLVGLAVGFGLVLLRRSVDRADRGTSAPTQ
jgi:hypothetical protein